MIKISFTTHRSTPRTKALIIFNVLLSFIISLIVTIPTSATLSRDQLEFFAQNGIFFYNPSNTVGSTSSICIGGSNTAYGGKQVFNETQMAIIRENQPIYQAAADEYGFPWQILAVLHSRENSLELYNHNDDGVYQIVSKSYPTGPVSEAAFIEMTKDAAEFIANIISTHSLNISNSTDIKRLFFYYNGTGNGSNFEQNAVKYGFSADEPWEGSSYVMNYSDEARSPMIGGYKGIKVCDSNGEHCTVKGIWDDSYESQQIGTYVMYVALGGSGSDGCFIQTNGGFTLQYGAQGMSEEEAVNFMQVYRDRVFDQDNKTLIDTYGLTYINEYQGTCTGGSVAYNCVSVSRYFVNTYTTMMNRKITEGLGNGIEVAPSLYSKYPNDFQECGPQAYAVFSGKGSGSSGHTGVILGTNIRSDTDGEIITGEASCGDGVKGIKVVIYPLTVFQDKYDHFACPVGGVYNVNNSGYVFIHTDKEIAESEGDKDWNGKLLVITKDN